MPSLNNELMTTVYACPGVDIELMSTTEPRIQILRVNVSEVPIADELEKILTVMSTFCENCEGRVIFHIRHVETETLKPPDLNGMLTIVGRLMALKDLVDTKLKGMIVQGRCIDELVRVTKNLFLSLYQPKKPFDIVASEDEVECFMRGILHNEAVKREKKRVKG